MNIKEIVKKENILIGTDEVKKGIKNKTVKEVYLAGNCPEQIANTLEHYAEIAGVKVSRLDIPNDELGIVCKKMFAISVIAVVS